MAGEIVTNYNFFKKDIDKPHNVRYNRFRKSIKEKHYDNQIYRKNFQQRRVRRRC